MDTQTQQEQESEIKVREQRPDVSNVGATMPFASVHEAGCFVCNWSGHLLRVPEEGLKPGSSPLLNIAGAEDLFVTKLSDDPFITISRARRLAANLDLNVNF